MKDWSIIRTLIILIDDERIHAILASMAAGLIVTQVPELGRFQDPLFGFFFGMAGIITAAITFGLSPKEIWLEVTGEFADDVAHVATQAYNPLADRAEDIIADTTGVRLHLNLPQDDLNELEPVIEDFIKQLGYVVVGDDYNKTVLPPGDIAG